uniref:hypothetical protein n=1 Tax=uncultured Adlercreutzia sp. TaxID=875803 RepID=UPI00265E54E1
LLVSRLCCCESAQEIVRYHAAFRLYAIYKKDNYERVRPALDAYTRARKIILNHGKGGTLVDSE